MPKYDADFEWLCDYCDTVNSKRKNRCSGCNCHFLRQLLGWPDKTERQRRAEAKQRRAEAKRREARRMLRSQLHVLSAKLLPPLLVFGAALAIPQVAREVWRRAAPPSAADDKPCTQGHARRWHCSLHLHDGGVLKCLKTCAPDYQARICFGDCEL